MGQCASSELPPPVPMNKNNGNGNAKAEEVQSTADSNSISLQSSCSSRNSFRGSPALWVSKRLSKKQKSRQLSAAFNILDSEVKGKLVNINIATEEELMTLEGVSRQLAQNIVEYRNTIGGFKRIEDLVLVSGIGASVLQNIKNDITIKKFPSYPSYAPSSRNHSFDSIPSSESLKSQVSLHSGNVASPCNGFGAKGSGVKMVNVNSATIFDLMNIKGMSQEIAANIVHYRSKKGNFKTIDELIKVKGLRHRSMGLLRVYLTCEPVSPTSVSDFHSISSSDKPLTPITSSKFTGHRRSYSAPLSSNANLSTVQFLRPEQLNAHRFSSEFSADLFELLSLRSERPHRYEVFNGYYRGRRAIRIGSWNLQNLTSDKINNPGVLEVICRTILENGFSLIALQEVMNIDVVEKICSELNYGSLRRIREWNGPDRNWKWQVAAQPLVKGRLHSEYAAYMYNTVHGVHLVSDSILQVQNFNGNKYSPALPNPYLGYFQVNDVELVLVNLHIRVRRNENHKIEEEEEGDDEDAEMKNEALNTVNNPVSNTPDYASLKPIIAALRSKLESEKHSIYLGTLGLPPDHPAFSVLRESSHICVLSSDDATDISQESPKGTEPVDNIWLSPHFSKLNTGSYGVIREGLIHMAIPRGWGWGGFVSDHCPLYCDLYTEVVNPGCKTSAQDIADQINLNINKLV